MKSKVIIWFLGARDAIRDTRIEILIACLALAIVIAYLLMSVNSDAKQKKALISQPSTSAMLLNNGAAQALLPDPLTSGPNSMFVANNQNQVMGVQEVATVPSNIDLNQINQDIKQRSLANIHKQLDVPNFLPAKLQLFEAHWQGMDTRRLDAELRQKLKYPKGLKGVMIEEVTLVAAASGLLAADIIVRIMDQRVETLEDFQLATRQFQNETAVNVGVLRPTKELNDDGRYKVQSLSITMQDELPLGFAQVEAAPMILPGSQRPHPHRGACTNCHNIGTGFELATPPDMITLPPPAITMNDVRKGIMPHRDRGECMACHVIK
ncbi:MAG: PDZ domain-containing protein [Zetaproteobacteria bacterium]|nr:PDZ domain-containing protein [Zetaproteobacteria bacterium]